MTRGHDAAGGRQPSWEQLLRGAHPAFGLAASRPGRPVVPRHGRDTVRPDDDLVDRRFAAIVHGLHLGTGATHEADDRDGMSWVDAAAWTVVAAGGTLLLAARLGDLLP